MARKIYFNAKIVISICFLATFLLIKTSNCQSSGSKDAIFLLVKSTAIPEKAFYVPWKGDWTGVSEQLINMCIIRLNYQLKNQLSERYNILSQSPMAGSRKIDIVIEKIGIDRIKMSNGRDIFRALITLKATNNDGFLENKTEKLEASTPIKFGSAYDPQSALFEVIDTLALKFVSYIQKSEDKSTKAQQLALEQARIQQIKDAIPSELICTANFEDSILLPNNILDAGETAILRINIKNNGKGAAFEIRLIFINENKEISIENQKIVGDILPGKSIDTIIPIKADLNISDGTANITIETKEKRGYDARPIQLQIPVRHLDKPALAFANFTVNDGSTGRAKGNGNGIAENEETVEVTAFVKNNGIGPALFTKAEIKTCSPGILVDQSLAYLGTIAPNETKLARMVVTIPRAFDGNQLQLDFSAQDTLGVSKISKPYILPMSRLAPLLTIDNRFLDEKGTQIEQVQNGARYVLEILVRNEGQLGAKSIKALISSAEVPDIVSSNAVIGDLAAGASGAAVRFPFALPRNYKAGFPRFTLKINQIGFSDISQNLSIPFVYKYPQLIIRESITTSDGNPEIQQGENVFIDLVVENQGNLDAENVISDFDIAHPGIDFRERTKSLGRIPAGSSSSTNRFSFLVKTGAAVGPLNGLLHLRQADFPAMDKPYHFEIKPIGAQVVAVKPTEQPAGVAGYGKISSPSNSAPFVALSAKNISADNKSSDPFVKLEIQIQDDKPMLSLEPEIRVNGKIQPKELGLRGIAMQERESKEIDRKIRLYRQVELNEGVNDIEIRVYDADNEMGFDNIQIEYLAQRTDVFALVVGVSNYQNSAIDPLKYAADDAQIFHDYLRTPQGGGLDGDHVRMLLNSEATRDNIINAMEWLANHSFENDLIIIYMAMHGMVDQGEFYFLGYDSDPKKLFASGIKRSEAEALQQRMKSKKVVWFADACHSGSLGEDSQISMRASRASSTNRLLGEIARARNGLALFMSAQAAEYSQESTKWGGGHGVFTHFLLKGLRGDADRNADSFITLSELYDFVSRQVSEATEGKQNPKLSGNNYDRSLTLSIVK